MVGKRAVKSGFDIEFNAARLPTLQIWGEKKENQGNHKGLPLQFARRGNPLWLPFALGMVTK